MVGYYYIIQLINYLIRYNINTGFGWEVIAPIVSPSITCLIVTQKLKVVLLTRMT